MTARLLDGRALAREHAATLRARIARLPRPPALAVVLVGDDPASAIYVRRKAERARRLGIRERTVRLPPAASQAEVEGAVAELAAEPDLDGILVQLPLPAGLDARAVLDRIPPERDVDGLHPDNAGRLAQGRPRLVPCTPAGIMLLLRAAGARLEGSRAVVVGRSDIVGRPVAMLLEHANATVTVCHSRTRDLFAVTREADVLVVAAGRPRLLRAEGARPGAVVVDVGIHRLDDGSLCGDVAADEVAEVASALTPVPGGVGPLTISMLMENTVRAAEAATGVRPW